MSEYPEVSNTRIVKARKAHKCCECGCEIKPGAQYESSGGVWDGEWSTYKTCDTCVTVRDWYAHKYPDDDYGFGGFVFQELWTNLYESWNAIGNAGENAIFVNLILSMMYRRSYVKQSRTTLDILQRLYGSDPYKVVHFMLPVGHIDQLVPMKFAEVVDVADAASIINDPTHTLLCHAPSGLIEVTAIIDSEELLKTFQNPMDTRPKTYMKISNQLLQITQNRNKKWALAEHTV